MFNDPLYIVPPNVHTRWASPENFGALKGGACANDDGRKRSAWFTLKAGESKALLNLSETSGTVRRIWATIEDRSPRMLRGLRIEAYWDGASEPAISAPFGDFFSHGLGRMTAFQSALFSSPEGRSFNCIVPMPFRSGARIVVTNESGIDQRLFFYDIDCTIGDEHPENVTYLHAIWRRENPTTFRQDYEILPLVRGTGRFLGANLGVIADTGTYFRSWWGEGEVKMYLDGDSDHPTLSGTGTEDYIGTAWEQGPYAHLYQGCTVADHARFQYTFYRLHVPDPVYFHQSARVTIQQIGCWSPDNLPAMAGTGLQLYHGDEAVDMPARVKEKSFDIFERRDDWSSCAWFYLDSPTNALPAIVPAAERWAGLG